MSNPELFSFMQIVEQMRDKQKKFFALRRDDPRRDEYKNNAKECEQKVDDYIKKHLSPELPLN